MLLVTITGEWITVYRVETPSVNLLLLRNAGDQSSVRAHPDLIILTQYTQLSGSLSGNCKQGGWNSDDLETMPLLPRRPNRLASLISDY